MCAYSIETATLEDAARFCEDRTDGTNREQQTRRLLADITFFQTL